MPKISPATTKQATEQIAWVDVSQDADAPNSANLTTSARTDEAPVWWLYLRAALCVLAIVWVTEWVTTRRMIAERPPLHIDATQTLAPPRDTAKSLLAATENATPVSAKIVVHIIGAVKKPGVYEVAPRARLRDAVHLAGGPLSAADLEAVNLAEFLADGQQYKIPQRNEKIRDTEISRAQISRAARVKSATPAVAIKAKPRAPKNVPLSASIDLNHASALELDALPDIGPTKAARIIEYRSQNGAFKSVDDLVEVEGIGEKTLEKLRPYVVIR